jgi:hypothetical protein
MKSRRKFLDFNLSNRKIKRKKLAVTKKSRLERTIRGGSMETGSQPYLIRMGQQAGLK